MSAILRQGAAEDAGLLASLHACCFDDAWDERAFRQFLAGAAFAFVAKTAAATELQGFILVQMAADESEILSIGTHPSARRCGLARALLTAAGKEAAQRDAARIFLEVAEDNVAALSLYRQSGFEVVGKRHGYYLRGGRPADALMLRANLPLRGRGNAA